MHDICVVGLGAIGAFYALALERSGEARVTAVCRSNFSVVSQHGLEVVSDRLGTCHWKPHRMCATPSEAADREYRFVICVTKALPDVTKTSKLLEPLLASTTTFVLVQNGVDIHLDMQEACPDADIISSCSWSDATAIDGGRKVVQTGPDGLTSGLHIKDIENPSAAGKYSLELLHSLLVKGGVGSEMTDNIVAARWRKVLWNAAISSMCTVTRSPVASLLSSQMLPAMLPVLQDLMKEVILVARSEGVTTSDLSDDAPTSVLNNCLDQYSDTCNSNPSLFKPSMLVDLEAGRPMEVEPIVGNVTRAGRRYEVQTPRLDILYAQLRVLQLDLLRSR
ncbi:6-phosphogluconate dehydrogenase C-terminal domain-like protein [Peniophora sp. CONT]|nr:6-phosphogluconate dehydrogenase C-terminal domain-like protein [Peniophora sp. CONT]